MARPAKEAWTPFGRRSNKFLTFRDADGRGAIVESLPLSKGALVNKSLLSRSLASTLLAGSFAALMGSPALAYDGSGSGYYAYDGGATYLNGALDSGLSTLSPGTTVGPSFDGISQVDVRALNNNFSFIPPDTMGAVGATQFLETSNGAYAIFDKTTGARQSIVSMTAFWQAAGQAGSQGDSRVLFDARSQRWIVTAFAVPDGNGNLPTLEIAVSNDSNALHGFKSTTFTGYSPPGSAPIADYPTLAIDGKAIYIGTNDFDLNNTTQQFTGTTLNVINRNDLFGPGAPTTTSLKQFFTPCSSTVCVDRGFAIQGVNQLGSDTGKILATAATDFGQIRYNVNNPGQASATETGVVTLDNSAYDPNSPGRQPDTLTGGTTSRRVIDTSDDRTSSAVWEQHGKIYSTQTITPTGTGHTSVRWSIVDAATNHVIAEGYIGNNNDGFDYYQGTITVNDSGQVVIGYNRSGYAVGVGNISDLANAYNPDKATGGLTLLQTYLLHVSPIDDYHNGSTQFSPPSGRQRWGDYAQVTLDPNNRESFWVIGEYALGYLPSPTGSFSRWGTWISDITLSPVPEPGTWALMLTGFGLIGGAARRRRGSALAV